MAFAGVYYARVTRESPGAGQLLDHNADQSKLLEVHFQRFQVYMETVFMLADLMSSLALRS